MKYHHLVWGGIILISVVYIIGVTIKLTMHTPSGSVPTEEDSTIRNPISNMTPTQSSDDEQPEVPVPQIPPPPDSAPDTQIVEYSNEIEPILLTENIPFKLHGMTLTLEGFNHKFQDSPDESYVWIDVTAQSDTTPPEVKSLVFHEHVFKDEQGVSQTNRTSSEFENYLFELSEVNYGLSIGLNVRKRLTQ